MKLIAITLLTLSLTACGLFGGDKDDGPSIPPMRETYHACPEYEKCAGRYKSGGICEPSGEHHSAPDKCPKVQ